MYSDSFANSRYYNNLVDKIVNAGYVKVFYASLEGLLLLLQTILLGPKTQFHLPKFFELPVLLSQLISERRSRMISAKPGSVPMDGA